MATLEDMFEEYDGQLYLHVGLNAAIITPEPTVPLPIGTPVIDDEDDDNLTPRHRHLVHHSHHYSHHHLAGRATHRHHGHRHYARDLICNEISLPARPIGQRSGCERRLLDYCKLPRFADFGAVTVGIARQANEFPKICSRFVVVAYRFSRLRFSPHRVGSPTAKIVRAILASTSCRGRPHGAAYLRWLLQRPFLRPLAFPGRRGFHRSRRDRRLTAAHRL